MSCDPSALLSALLFAGLGALSLELLNLAQALLSPGRKRPRLREPTYWFALLILTVLGAAVAAAYVLSGVTVVPIIAMNIGAAAPAMIRMMTDAAPRLL